MSLGIPEFSILFHQTKQTSTLLTSNQLLMHSTKPSYIYQRIAVQLELPTQNEYRTMKIIMDIIEELKLTFCNNT